MSYFFNNYDTPPTNAHRISRSTGLNWYSVSAWFRPTSSPTDDGTIFSIHSSNGVSRLRVYLSISDNKVYIEDPSSATLVGSSGTVNYGSWNHVYAATGVVSANTGYISLNGETLQSGTLILGGAAKTGTAIGVYGTLTRNDYFYGEIAEVGAWNFPQNDIGDAYKALAKGVPPDEIPVDPSDTFGFGSGNNLLIAYWPGLGTFQDRVLSTAWSALSAPTASAEHPAMKRWLE